MAGFLRKKSNKQPQPTPTPSGPISIGGPTPLYAKFTSVTTNGRSTGSGGKRKQGTISREDRDSTTSLLPIQAVPSSSGDHAPVPVDVLSSSPPASTLVTNRRLSRGGGGGAPRPDTLIPSEALFSTPKVLTRSTADNQDGSGGSGRHNLQPGSLRGAKGITHEVSITLPGSFDSPGLGPPGILRDQRLPIRLVLLAPFYPSSSRQSYRLLTA
ncbi:hypothetical protein ARMGADRAFT_785330 [Armillaria gallica]|uniref:Uncharacterized protein n=1 Tax=Armillaria gallica TaxID=47427 RepID=A0A2H3CQ34_ARMGA|nr:hypothetical protein ARMGADRAFT_785330 [Armillaria gallica]